MDDLIAEKSFATYEEAKAALDAATAKCALAKPTCGNPNCPLCTKPVDYR